MKLDHLQEQMATVLDHRLETWKQQVNGLTTHMNSLNPKSILKRGYAIVTRHGDHRALKDTSDIQPGEDMDVTLSRGVLVATVKKGSEAKAI